MRPVHKQKPIKKIGVFGKSGDRQIGEIISTLVGFLRARDLEVVLEATTAGTLDTRSAGSLRLGEIGRHIDLGIVIGGDGTLLNVARNLAAHNVPLIAVNKGRLGFLADIAPDDMLQTIGNILDGDFRTEERFLLAAEIVRDDVVVHTANALNDVVVHKSGLARLIEFETFVDDDFVYSALADGLIVATPTGSTAYALSAGGPILHPTLPAIALVPICPHALSNRPLVLNNNSRIEVMLTGGHSAHVTFDGQSSYPLRDRERVRVRRADTPVTLVHPADRNHYDVLRRKLHWARRF